MKRLGLGAKLRQRITVVLMIAVLAGSVGAVWYFKFQTYHFAVVKDGVLYRDGNRDLREFVHAVERSQAKTVVSLVDEKEVADPKKPQFTAEAAWCATHGVRQIRIPVKLGGWPTAADVRHFLDVVQMPGNRPVLVHCAQGVRRTGMFVAAYEMTVEHQPAAGVKTQIKAFNHRPGDTDDVRTFIDLYQPVSGGLPSTMPAASGE